MSGEINNDFYGELGDRWYRADDDPIALLRAESRLRNPWVVETIRRELQGRAAGDVSVLDIGCGAGFLANDLARAGFAVTGVDLSESSLEVARRFDSTGTVRYERHDARALPHSTGTFDVACAMDFLEHVEDPAAVVASAGRVLKPGGLFFFHTFNRTWRAWLFASYGLELVFPGAPERIHLHRLFIKPSELRQACEYGGLSVAEIVGVQPIVFSGAFLRLLATGRVAPDFHFRFCRSLAVGYSGWARKIG